MRSRNRILLWVNLLVPLACFLCTFLFLSSEKRDLHDQGDALEAFNWWYGQRAGSNGLIPTQALPRALAYAKNQLKAERAQKTTSGTISQWQSIGPNNVAGRILSLAVDPSNPNVLWAGAASGGLWKSTTKGIGSSAWTYVNTGFPSISISAIAIDQNDPDIMYIGTGEISYYHYPLIGTPGARASYGMGILKSTDGGASWSQTSLTYTFSQITAIEKIVINPLNPKTVFAATSEGIYKSTNAGANWTQSLFVVMAMDLVINPSDTTVLISAHGNLNSSSNQGMYKTTNAGASWMMLTNGLPSANFGRTSLAIAASNPQIVYAGISSGSSHSIIGLYQSTDGGNSWTQTSSINYVGNQGWYDNVVAVHPQNANTVFCAGIDLYKSTNGGLNLSSVSRWTTGFSYFVPAGGPEGDSSYVHADHHAIAFDPNDSNTIYIGTDGGVFQTTNGGVTFSGRNGGLVTTQFYSGFANSGLTTTEAFGGLQDNGTLKYTGTTTWAKVDVGDGGWCAVNPQNDDTVYDEYVYLAISKSINSGFTFGNISGGLPSNTSSVNFIAPFVVCPSNPNILYAGARTVFKTTNAGATSWFAPNSGNDLNGTNISVIGVSWTNADSLMAATGTGTYNASPSFQVFASGNGAATWKNVTGTLPAVYPTRIYFSPSDSKTAYITYSGYGNPHVFKTTNFGQTWTNVTSNLPDAPVQSIVSDPLVSGSLFVGTDLGVYNSTDDGATWNDFNAGMSFAMVTDVSIFKPGGMLRASTFGNGVYQRSLPRVPSLSVLSPAGGEYFIAGKTYPVTWVQRFCDTLTLEFSSDGGTSWDTIATNIPAASGSYAWTVPSDSTHQGSIRFVLTSDGTILGSTQVPFSIIINPDVLAGWNIVSIPFSPVNNLRTELFPNAGSEAFLFRKGYQTADTLLPGYGYWLKFNQPQHVAYTGDSLATDTVNVVTGWNMIGSISSTISTDQIQESVPGMIVSLIYGYNDGYSKTDSIKPMHGYWLKVNQNGELIFSTSTAFAKRQRNRTTSFDGLSSLIFKDKSGGIQKLYLVNNSHGNAQVTNYELPPLPPAGVYDVRFGSNMFAETLPDEPGTSVELPIDITSGDFPLTVQFDDAGNLQDNLSLVIDGKELTLPKNGTIRINEAISQINLKVTGAIKVPVTFTLEQNYPNPFNPTTNLEFRIAKFGLATLKIYNMLGEEVATLVNKKLEPGTYTTPWDASNMPSGIYFYRLQVGTDLITKKMVLVR